METSRLKMLSMAVGMAAASVVLGSITDDADAAGRMQPQTPVPLVDQDGTVERKKGVVTAKSGKFLVASTLARATTPQPVPLQAASYLC